MFVLSSFEKVFSFFLSPVSECITRGWLLCFTSPGSLWPTSVRMQIEEGSWELGERQPGEATMLPLLLLRVLKKGKNPSLTQNNLTSITSVHKYDWAALHELVQDINPTLAPKINQWSLQTAQTADAFHWNYCYIGMNKVNPTYTSNRFLNLMIFSFGLKFPSQIPEGSMCDYWELADQGLKSQCTDLHFTRKVKSQQIKTEDQLQLFFHPFSHNYRKVSAQKVITITLIIAQWCSLKILKYLDMV